jgi:hypothetical protein
MTLGKGYYRAEAGDHADSRPGMIRDRERCRLLGGA